MSEKINGKEVGLGGVSLLELQYQKRAWINRKRKAIFVEDYKLADHNIAALSAAINRWGKNPDQIFRIC